MNDDKIDSMKEWVKNYFKEQWLEIDSDIDFTKYEPVYTSNSLHIYEEKYEIEGDTYRLLYSISESNSKPTVEILNKD